MSCFQHYRFSTVGLALQEVLDEMVEKGTVCGDAAAQLLLVFDQAISSALRTHVRAKAMIQGDVHYYRNVNGIFEINLRRADIELDGVKHQVDHHIRLIAVDGRVPAAASEARLRRPDRGGGSGSSDGALV